LQVGGVPEHNRPLQADVSTGVAMPTPMQTERAKIIVNALRFILK